MPVIPFKMYHQFINASKIADYDTKLIEIKNLVQALPKVHYDVLDFLMRHLVNVAARSEVNKMETSNLAIVFGPSLLRLEEKGEADMQQQIANMMNMSSQNSLIENIITQAGVDFVELLTYLVAFRWKSELEEIMKNILIYSSVLLLTGNAIEDLTFPFGLSS